MNDTQQINEEILNALVELMKKYPQMRFGQLVTNVAYWAIGPTNSAIWEVSNEEWLNAANKNLEKT